MPNQSTYIRRASLAGVAAAVALAVTAQAAVAHVTAQPGELPAGEFVKVTFRTPNERGVDSTRLAVELPPELDAVKVQPVTGWTYKVTRKKLAKPRKVFGETVSDYVARVTWSKGRIEVPEFQEFPVSMKLPERGTFGKYVVFPALQSYANGEVVRWIEKPESPSGKWDDLENPAAHLELTSAEGSAAAEPKFATAADVDDETKGPRTLAIVALIVGGLGLLIGIAGVARSKRA